LYGGGLHAAKPDHLPVILGKPLIKWDYNRSAQIGDSRCDCPNDGYIRVIGNFRKLRVIVLEDSEGEWKALAIL